MANKITKANIKETSPLPCCTINEVWVKIEKNHSEVKIFEYYPDELHFNEDELIGLTVSEAVSLKMKKDIAYLQS